MATGPCDYSPPECMRPVGSTATTASLWQPDSLNMHVTRPKSAKGRTRPRLHKHLGTEGGSFYPSFSTSSHSLRVAEQPRSWACSPDLQVREPQ